MSPTSWFPRLKPPEPGRVRLYCFHHAGGAAQMFRSWIGSMAGVEVCPVQLPGRWERLREPAFTRMEPLIDALAPVLLEHAGAAPFAFYGHSLGGLVAFELARRLAARGPARLLVSGRAARRSG